jgi:hypothetical protein
VSTKSTTKPKEKSPPVKTPAISVVKKQDDTLQDDQVTCPQCLGTKIEEIQVGLISRRCRLCDGAGKIPKSQYEKLMAAEREAKVKADEANRVAAEAAAKVEATGGIGGESGTTN